MNLLYSTTFSLRASGRKQYKLSPVVHGFTEHVEIGKDRKNEEVLGSYHAGSCEPLSEERGLVLSSYPISSIQGTCFTYFETLIIWLLVLKKILILCKCMCVCLSEFM